MSKMIGKIIQVIGPVIDVSFEETGTELPSIHEALEVERHIQTSRLYYTSFSIGEHTVRTIAMDSTDGLQRGLKVTATGEAIKMPVGDTVKGRLFNVVGEAIDGIGSVDKTGVTRFTIILPNMRIFQPSLRFCLPG